MLNFRAVVADVVAVFLFALLARVAHNTPDMPLSVGGWLETAWPFVCGTVLGWGLLVFNRQASDAELTSRGWIVWIATAATGLILWGLRHGALPHWSFILVATLMSGLLIMGWRLIWSKVRPAQT